MNEKGISVTCAYFARNRTYFHLEEEQCWESPYVGDGDSTPELIAAFDRREYSVWGSSAQHVWSEIYDGAVHLCARMAGWA